MRVVKGDGGRGVWDTPVATDGHRAGWKTIGKQMKNEGFREWAIRVLRVVLGGVPELILESPEVPLEPLGVILGHPGSIRSSGFWFPGLSGIQNCQASSFWQQWKSF